MDIDYNEKFWILDATGGRSEDVFQPERLSSLLSSSHGMGIVLTLFQLVVVVVVVGAVVVVDVVLS